MLAVTVLQVTSMVRALRVMSWVMAMLMRGVAGGAPAAGAAGTACA